VVETNQEGAHKAQLTYGNARVSLRLGGTLLEIDETLVRPALCDGLDGTEASGINWSAEYTLVVHPDSQAEFTGWITYATRTHAHTLGPGPSHRARVFSAGHTQVGQPVGQDIQGRCPGSRCAAPICSRPGNCFPKMWRALVRVRVYVCVCACCVLVNGALIDDMCACRLTCVCDPVRGT
jgi:hypothetical protein